MTSENFQLVPPYHAVISYQMCHSEAALRKDKGKEDDSDDSDINEEE